MCEMCERLLAALKHLEPSCWKGTPFMTFCKWCGGQQPYHKEDCTFALIAEIEGKKAVQKNYEDGLFIHLKERNLPS